MGEPFPLQVGYPRGVDRKTPTELANEVERVVSKKKVLLIVALAGATYLGVRRAQSSRAEQNLWAEATDPVPPFSRS